MAADFSAELIYSDTLSRFLVPECAELGNSFTLTLSRRALVENPPKLVRFHSSLTTVSVPAEGYMFYPADFHLGCALTYFTSRPDSECHSRIDSLSFAGIGGCEGAVMLQITGGNADSRIHTECRSGVCQLCAEFVLNGDPAEEDLTVVYRRLPNASYSDMARIYRSYQLRENGCVPLRERVKNNPVLKYAAESMEFRIRMGWKPVPTPVPHQTEETEPPVRVVCDLRKLEALLRELRAQGVGETEICLVGWGRGGHDGRFPQQVPVEPAYGSDEELRRVIALGQELGYQLVCHTGSVQAYEVADNFDLNAMRHVYAGDGTLYAAPSGYCAHGGLSGGYPYTLCPREAFARYAVNDLPKVRDYGFRGCHFVDELTAVEVEKCYHPDHPATRRQGEEAYRNIARLSRELFGGFQSEGWMDFMNAETDYIMYTSFRTKLTREENQLFDEMIPLWQLVYHGIVLSSPSSTTVNHLLKGPDEHLRFLEFGGRPLLYLYSKFGEGKNWMGDIDLRCETLEDVPACAAELKRAWDEFLPLRSLQYEFMEEHKKLSDGVYRVTYSDRTAVTVDYNEKTCVIEKDGVRRAIPV